MCPTHVSDGRRVERHLLHPRSERLRDSCAEELSRAQAPSASLAPHGPAAPTARHGAAPATAPPLALPPWSLVVSRGPITRAAQMRDVPRDTPSRGQAHFLAAPCRRPPSGVKWSGVKWSQVETKSSGVKWSPSQVESSGVKHMSNCFGVS